MGLGIVFSGQGNQTKDMFAKSASLLNVDYINNLSRKLGVRLIPQIDLDDKSIFVNSYAQPLIAGYQFCVWDYLKCHLPEPIAFAGYSLGEVTAILCASQFSFDELVEITQNRAKLMSGATEKQCAMLAVSGVLVEVIQDICSKNNTYISIENSLQNVIIGGEYSNVSQCDIEIKRLPGLIRTQWLKIDIASHTPLLASAKSQFAGYLAQYADKTLDKRTISGINAHVQYDLLVALADLSSQICQTIYFDKVVQVLYEMGADIILEIGSGHALANIIKQQKLPIQVKSVDDFKSLTDIPAWVNKQLNT